METAVQIADAGMTKHEARESLMPSGS